MTFFMDASEELSPQHLYKPTLGTHAASAPPHSPHEAFTATPVAILALQMSHHSTSSDSKIEITTIKTTIDPSGRLPLLVAAVANDTRNNAIPTYTILGMLKSALTGGRATPNFILDVITYETSVRGIPVEIARFNHKQSVSLAAMGHPIIPRLTVRSASDLKQFRYSFAGYPGHHPLRVGDTALAALAEALGNPEIARNVDMDALLDTSQAESLSKFTLPDEWELGNPMSVTSTPPKPVAPPQPDGLLPVPDRYYDEINRVVDHIDKLDAQKLSLQSLLDAIHGRSRQPIRNRSPSTTLVLPTPSSTMQCRPVGNPRPTTPKGAGVGLRLHRSTSPTCSRGQRSRSLYPTTKSRKLSHVFSNSSPRSPATRTSSRSYRRGL